MKSIQVIVSFIILLSSCSKDDPVGPSEGLYQFDSARYEWRTDTLQDTYGGDIFGFDSSHVYILDNHSIFIYNGKEFSRHFLGSMYFSAIDGLDPYNVYIAGAYSNGDYRLVKWNGTSFEDIPAPSDTSQNNGFISILVKSSDEIWLGTVGKIFLYNGVSFSEYIIDSSSVAKYLTENEGRLLASGRRPICPDSSFTNCKAETNVYQYDNNNWVRVNTTSTNYDVPQFYPVVVGKSLYGNMQEGIFKFVNSDFFKIINSPSPYLITFVVGGKNMNELTSVAFSNVEQFYINWNGSKWSKEFSDAGSILQIKNIGNYYYTISEYCFSCHYVILRIGKPK